MVSSDDLIDANADDSSSLGDGHPVRALARRAVVDSADVVNDVRRHTLLAKLGLDPQPSTRLGRYVALGVLGRGGMGTVLKAYDEELDRAVAIKLLHGEAAEREAVRLKREARALAKLSHANVVQVYEVGETEGHTFIAMELVKGQTLSEWARREPRPGWRECVAVYLQAGAGLAAAHAEGLVHRDFKPGNAVIDAKRQVRVLDFGLARGIEGGGHVSASDGKAEVVTPPRDGTPPSSLTRTGMPLGTPGYMPPEQIEGEPADARSDQFSFCVSLYEAVYGERPFVGKSLAELATTIRDGEIRGVSNGTKAPAKLRQVILRGLAARPEARWPSMDALLAELRKLVAPRGTRWLALGVLGGLVAIGIGLGMEQYAEVMNRCAGAESQLAGIWDEGRRQEVKEAVLGTKLSYASDTWVRVEQGLDEYAGAWADKHTEVCKATSVRQEQSPEVMDLRMECLRGRRVELREAVGVLVRADAVRVEKAVELVAGLPGLSRCDDVQVLSTELPPPDDPRVAAQVNVLRERLAYIRALTNAAIYDDALMEAEGVVEQAEGISYAPLLAEALLERGRARQELAQYAAAEQDVERAYLLAAQHGHDEVEAVAVGQLVRIVGVQEARYEPGLQWGKTALALAKSRRFEAKVEADSLDYIGRVLRDQGELDDALTYQRRALAIWEELAPGHPNVASSLNGIGGTLWDQGKLEEALTHYQRALAIHEHTLGPRHPNVASSLNNIGNVLYGHGKFEEALTHYQHALAIYEDALGPHHPSVASSLNNIGAVLQSQGKLEEAVTHHQRALTIYEQTLGAHHPTVATAYTNVGLVLWRQGKLEEALTHHQHALTIYEEVLDPGHASLAFSHTNIGLVLWAQGELEEALTHHERALAILEATSNPAYSNLAFSLETIGLVLRSQGRLEEALTYQRRALAVTEEALGPNHTNVASSLSNIAFVLCDQGKLEEAVTYHQRALVITEETLGPRHPDVASSLIGLAEIALKRHQHETAREYAERAVSVLESSEGSRDFLAKARFAFARALWLDGAQRLRARELAEQARNGYSELGVRGESDVAEVEQWLAEHRLR